MIVIFIVAFILAGFRIVNEYVRGVVFRLGRFSRIKGPGLYWIVPLIEWQRTIDMRTRTVTVERQETITRDSVTIKVDAVLWYRVTDPAKAVIAVENYSMAVHQPA
jgi:regulator of protease activity HflC (stomatin/prohibitin superfamily)